MRLRQVACERYRFSSEKHDGDREAVMKSNSQNAYEPTGNRNEVAVDAGAEQPVPSVAARKVQMAVAEYAQAVDEM